MLQLVMDIIELNKKAWDTIGPRAGPTEIIHEKYRKMFELFCSKIPKNAKVLDLGCGTGLPAAKELVRRGFKVTGVDLSDTMVKLATNNVPEAEFIRCSMTEINFVDEFEGIMSNYSMLCLDIENFRKTAGKIADALKKNGWFLLRLNELISEDWDEKENYTIIMDQKMYSRPYSENEIREIFGSFGLVIVKIEREILESEEYGKEHSLLVLMQKE